MILIKYQAIFHELLEHSATFSRFIMVSYVDIPKYWENLIILNFKYLSLNKLFFFYITFHFRKWVIIVIHNWLSFVHRKNFSPFTISSSPFSLYTRPIDILPTVPSIHLIFIIFSKCQILQAPFPRYASSRFQLSVSDPKLKNTFVCILLKTFEEQHLRCNKFPL